MSEMATAIYGHADFAPHILSREEVTEARASASLGAVRTGLADRHFNERERVRQIWHCLRQYELKWVCQNRTWE